MKLPAILSAATIQALAATDTHAVRIILMSSAGPTNYTLRGNGRRRGKYILVRDGVLGRHILDVPVSVWNEGMPAGRYLDNLSISHDLMSKPNPLTPFVTMIVPWKGAVEWKAPDAGASYKVAVDPSSVSPSAEMVDLLETAILRLAEARDNNRCRELLTPYLHGAIERQAQELADAVFADAGRSEILAFTKKMWPDTPEEQPEEKAKPETQEKTETAAAKRMRLMRERKKALAANKLQTANA